MVQAWQVLQEEILTLSALDETVTFKRKTTVVCVLFASQLSYRELQLQTLWLTFLSFDPSSRHEVIGQVVVPLADLELSNENVFRTDIRPSLKVK